MNITLYTIFSNNIIYIISCNEYEDVIYINNEKVSTNDDIISVINLFKNEISIVDIKNNEIIKNMFLEVKSRYLNNELKDNELLFIKCFSLEGVV